MTTTTLDPKTRTDDERLLFIEDHDVPSETRLDDEDQAGRLRERYDEQILAGLVTF